MNKKLNVTIKVMENVDWISGYYKLLWRESEREDLTVEEVIHFVLEFFERIDVLFFSCISYFT